MDVRVQRAVEADGVRIREELGVTARLDKATEDLVAGLDVHLSTAIVDGVVDFGFTVGAKGAVKAGTFHGVAEELVIGFGGIESGVFFD